MGVEFYESNARRAYPFVTSRGVYSGHEVDGLIVDATASHQDLCLYSLTLPVTDDVHPPTAVLVPEAGGSTISLGVAKSVKTLGAYTVLQWWDTTHFLNLVCVSSHPLATTTATLSFASSPSPFVSRTVAESSQMLTAIQQQIDVDLYSDIVGPGGTANLVEGHNVQLLVDPNTAMTQLRGLEVDTARSEVRRITINAAPGLGEGQRTSSCDTPILDLRTINGVGAENGDFVLESGNDCHRITRTTSDPDAGPVVNVDHALTIHNDCVPCCHCADFAALLEEIRTLVDKGLAIKQIWKTATEKYTAILAAWNEQQNNCFGEGLSSRVQVYAYTGWLASVQIYVGNASKTCAKDGVTVGVEFRGVPVTIIPGSCMVTSDQSQYTQIHPTFSEGLMHLTDNSALSPGGYKMITFSVRALPSDFRAVGATLQVIANLDVGTHGTNTLFGATKLIPPTLKH